MSEPRFDVAFGAASHRGMVRPGNEDSYLTVPPIFLVADGMGGHARGEMASKAVVDAFLVLGTHEWLSADDLVDAVSRASSTVTELAGEGRAPGSTLTGTGLTQQGGMPCWLMFNIGDSRTHLLRDGLLTQISVDHSVAMRRGEPGRLAPKNVITRALGAGLSEPVADQWLIPAQVGDRVLICSDGLTNEVTPELMTATLLSLPDAQEASQALVQAALNAGGRDNVTAVIVDCVAIESTADIDVQLGEETASDDTVPDPELED